ncbi:MAG: hypothetical protein QM757_15470 [Paludibaculum sp.]
MSRPYAVTSPIRAWRENREAEKRMAKGGALDLSSTKLEHWQMDELRLCTTVNNRQLRTRFCRDFQRRFPLDRDNGCPANLPPPATIVTENGDVPLRGEWPKELVGEWKAAKQ